MANKNSSNVIDNGKLSSSTLRAYERLSKDSPLVYGGPIKTLLDAYEAQQQQLDHLLNDVSLQQDEIRYLRDRLKSYEGRA